MVIGSNIWTLSIAPELANLEGEEEEDPELLIDNQSWLDGGSEHELGKDRQAGPKRRARQLTEEDLPVNDYVSKGIAPGVPWPCSQGVPALLLEMPCACPWGVSMLPGSSAPSLGCPDGPPRLSCPCSWGASATREPLPALTLSLPGSRRTGWSSTLCGTSEATAAPSAAVPTATAGASASPC